MIRVAIYRHIQHRRAHLLVALDGGSGAGKSTLAARLEQEIAAVVVPLDDFFAAHIPDWEWDMRSVAERAREVYYFTEVRPRSSFDLVVLG
jgi:uridine kinase